MVTAGNVILVLEVDLEECLDGSGETGDGVDGGMSGDVGVERDGREEGGEKETDRNGVENVGEKRDGKWRWMGRYRIANEKWRKKKNKKVVVAYAVFVKHGPRKEDLKNWCPDSLGKSTSFSIPCLSLLAFPSLFSLLLFCSVPFSVVSTYFLYAQTQ